MSKYKKMNPELKQKWLEALRSGKYEQGMGWLRSYNDRFCCFGVLCDVFNPDEWKEERIGVYVPYGPELCSGLLLPKEQKLLNISVTVQKILTNMNDNGKSFSEIADWIEENL